MDDNQRNNGPEKGNGNDNRGGRNGQFLMSFIIISLLVLFFVSMFTNRASTMSTQEITYSQFLNAVEADKVESVTIGSSQINITLKEGESLEDESETESTEAEAETENSAMSAYSQMMKSAVSSSDVTYYTGYITNLDLITTLREHDVEFKSEIPDNTSAWIYNILSIILPLALIWFIMGMLLRRMGGSGGMMGVGKSTAKVYNVERATGVTFKDVAGQDEAKESLQEIVDFLYNPKKYRDIGAKLPKGALLVGPPGTGKTLLAKAVAGEAKVPFYSLAGSDFVEMFVGVGASRVRDLFKEAEKNAPCIIFIDEIDAIGKSRDSRIGGNDEREQTLNQLLAEMDGFDTSKALFILAATNRPEVLDKALLRPGRFDRRIIVDKPDQKGRLETLKVHSKDVMMDETVDLEALAVATAGLVGSDLANMINEGAINAVKHGRKFVNQSDLFEAFELVAVGGKEKKDRVMSEKERRIVSYHEVGHALVSALQKNTEPVQKITIVPRTMGALGYTLQTPEEEKFLDTKEELLAKIVTFMGGRAAEEIKFNSITSGAANDIEQATNIAKSMITRFGMSEKFGMMNLVSIESQYLSGRASMNCADSTAAVVDEEVRKLIQSSYDEAKRLLKENMESLDKISEYLYNHETITGKEFMKIFREIKGIPEPDESETSAADRLQGNTDDKAKSDLSEDVSKEEKPVKEEPAKEKAESEVVFKNSFEDTMSEIRAEDIKPFEETVDEETETVEVKKEEPKAEEPKEEAKAEEPKQAGIPETDEEARLDEVLKHMK
ncbi:MAG: ATP-dependent zinc metalloprotease FtsH [Lachnospiraceae bacterium]|nr:ATP-dependent zinc metalloprotease FtsH [Lachnospiraceae bacterium]